MKKSVFFKTLCLAFLAAFVLSACSDDESKNYPKTDETDSTKQYNVEQDNSPTSVVAFISSNIGPAELRSALQKRFPMQTSIDKAQIAFLNKNEITENTSELKECLKNGGIIVNVNPDKNSENFMCKEFGTLRLPEQTQYGVFLTAFTGNNKYYNVFSDNPELTIDKFENNHTQEQEDWLNYWINKAKTSRANDVTMFTRDEDYFLNRIRPFVEWAKKNVGYKLTESGSGYDPTLDISRSYIDISHTFPISLHHTIDQGTFCDPDDLNKDSQIEVNYKLYQVYVLQCNDNDAPGDYYIFEGSVTAHNGQVWGPYNEDHGGCNDRVIGYFMNNMKFTYSLVDSDNKTVSNLKFYSEPMPTTTEGSTTYSDSHTVGFSAGITGGYASNAPTLQGSAGFNASWTSSVSQTLSDVKVVLNSDDSHVFTHEYHVQNINCERDWDAIDKDYPQLSRSDLRGSNTWIWKVPAGTAGVADNSSTSFKLKIDMSANYGAYNWWRGASWDYRHDWTISDSFTQELPTPNRQTFGVVALKNASGDYTVANIRIWKSDATSGDPLYTVSSSYNQNEVAKVALATDDYLIKFDFVDSTSGKTIETRKFEKVSTHAGRNEDEATTAISTVNSEVDK